MLLATLSSGDTLLMHLGMSGSFRVSAAPGAGAAGSADEDRDPHDHVVFHLDSGADVVFNDPRRFGVMDLVPPGCWNGTRPLARSVPNRCFDALPTPPRWPRRVPASAPASRRRCSISGSSPAWATST